MIELGELWSKIKPLVVGLISPGSWKTYTPTLTASITNPTLGSGATQTGIYQIIGNTLFGSSKILFGSGMSAGSGTYYIALPVPAKFSVSYQLVGSGYIYDQSRAAVKTISAEINNTDVTVCRIDVSDGLVATNVAPWTWAKNDTINLMYNYEVG